MSPALPDDENERAPRSRTRFEVIFASAWIGFGLLVLPALIYWMGSLLLGPYGENAGVGQFYGAFFSDLAEPSGRAWIIMLGPVATIYALRLIFRNRAPATATDDPDRSPSPSTARPEGSGKRVEPRLGID